MTLVYPFFLFLFLPAFLACFALAGRIGGNRGALGVLILASLFFAASQGTPFLIVMIASTLINAGLLFATVSPAQTQHRRARIASVGIALNILLLAVVKYSIWLQWLPGIGPLSATLGVLIPTTLSFLTFQRAVALLDALALPRDVAFGLDAPPGGQAPSRADRMLRYGAFATMFPTLLIGPIAYLVEVLPQIARRSFGRLRGIDLAVGVTLLSIGVFKKFVLADQIGADWVDQVYARIAAGNAVNSHQALEALIAYYAQLYFDFSGYSDIALGVARMIGITLPINFDSPLRATGIIDFYRRWHMTLTRVIARFLFSPLSIAGSRYAARRRMKGVPAKIVSLWGPLLINFTIIGLWHGPRLTFVLFGLIHGTWYVIETEFRSARRWKKRRAAIAEHWRLAGGAVIAIPLLIVTFALFRSPTLATFGALLRNVFAGQPGAAPLDQDQFAIPVLVVAYAIAMFMPNAYELMRRYRAGLPSFVNPSRTLALFQFRWRPTLLWGVATAFILLIAMKKMAVIVPFVYQVF
ncbi:MBOAT family O-acyltransferase [Sphingomonas sp.]|uniref:MBOAT family O-acyltransferase n=1 Tax=Sphingomonas sp. TaxID=28214 RepID=UPI002E31B691|nr:MBOAT family O-acyltransferase [Sphingomonas sp.]HEX4695900.1 MBOAT family O-acyltransferase [Sphingomonas sp.]